MKGFRWAIVLFVVIYIFGDSFTVMALDTGFTTQALPAEEISNIVKQREFVKVTTYAPLTAKCFDVRDDHMVLIGAKTGDTAIVAVYDDSGIFQYAFETKEYGSFRVMWIDNAIAYYSIRSAFVFIINEDGKITDVRHAVNSMENSIYDRDILLSTTRKVGNSTYSMTNENVIVDSFSASFNKIIRTDAEGTRVIYDASSNQHIRIAGGLVIFLVLLSLIVTGSILGIKRHLCKCNRT